MSVHGVADYLLTGDAARRQRALDSANNIVDKFVSHMDDADVLFGFPEEYESDWSVRYDKPNVSVGHLLKSAWVLAEMFRIDPNPEYQAASERIIDEVLDYTVAGNEAYDHVNGGVYTLFKWATGARVDSSKRWYMQEYGLNAGMSTWFNGGDDRYLQMADDTVDFFATHHVDDEFGGVYHSTTETGEPLDTRKGHRTKAMYHSAEIAYYAYLYGKLFYHEDEVTLYYQFDTKSEDYDVTLTPLAMPEGCLEIDEVEVDGEEYDEYDEESRTITVEEGVGGIFKVTFELKDDCPRRRQ